MIWKGSSNCVIKILKNASLQISRNDVQINSKGDQIRRIIANLLQSRGKSCSTNALLFIKEETPRYLLRALLTFLLSCLKRGRTEAAQKKTLPKNWSSHGDMFYKNVLKKCPLLKAVLRRGGSIPVLKKLKNSRRRKDRWNNSIKKFLLKNEQLHWYFRAFRPLVNTFDHRLKVEILEKIMRRLFFTFDFTQSRRSRSQVLFKICALKNLAEFTGKHLRWSMLSGTEFFLWIC